MNRSTLALSITFVVGFVTNLAPNVWATIITQFQSSNVSFSYEYGKADGNIWKKILEDRLGVVVSPTLLIDGYKVEVEEQLKQKGYTIDKVMKEDRVKIPMNIAIEKLNKINDPIFRVMGAPFLAEFVVENNSSSGLVVESVTISTGAIYDEPIAIAIPSFPYEGKCTFDALRGENGGFIVKCRDTRNASLTIPKNANLKLAVAGFLQVKEDTTFVRGAFSNEKSRSEDFYVTPTKGETTLATRLLVAFISGVVIVSIMGNLKRGSRKGEESKFQKPDPETEKDDSTN